MRSAKQLVCDLFLSRNCEIKSFRQLMSSRATPSDTAASFEIISLSRSTCTVEIKDHQWFNFNQDRFNEEVTNNVLRQSVTPRQSPPHVGRVIPSGKVTFDHRPACNIRMSRDDRATSSPQSKILLIMKTAILT